MSNEALALWNMVAAMIQAVGTIGALAVAIALPRLESRQSENRAALLLQIPLREAWFAVDDAWTYDREDISAVSNTMNGLIRAQQRLDAVPVERLSGVCADNAQFIRNQIHLMIEQFEQSNHLDRDMAGFHRADVATAIKAIYANAKSARDEEIEFRLKE